MDGSIFRTVHLCPSCHRITWQPPGDECRLCQKGAVTPA